MRRRKSTINTSVEFGVRSSEFGKVDASKREWVDKRVDELMWPSRVGFALHRPGRDQRTMIRRMPSSMIEKAQISKEPKATGVNMRSSIITDLIAISIMCPECVACTKAAYQRISTSEDQVNLILYVFLPDPFIYYSLYLC